MAKIVYARKGRKWQSASAFSRGGWRVCYVVYYAMADDASNFRQLVDSNGTTPFAYTKNFDPKQFRKLKLKLGKQEVIA